MADNGVVACENCGVLPSGEITVSRFTCPCGAEAYFCSKNWDCQGREEWERPGCHWCGEIGCFSCHVKCQCGGVFEHRSCLDKQEYEMMYCSVCHNVICPECSGTCPGCQTIFCNTKIVKDCPAGFRGLCTECTDLLAAARARAE